MIIALKHMMKAVNCSIVARGLNKALHKLVSQTCNDSWELFEDIQKYNPYTKKMIVGLNESFKKVVDSLGDN